MGKSSSADKSAGKAAQAQAQLAQQLIRQSDPTRQQLFSQTNQFLAGDRDVTGLPTFQAGRDIIGQQFGRARDSIIASTPEGGALTAALTDLERGRVSDIAQLTGQLSENEVNRGVQLGTFGAAAGTQGFAGAAATQAQRAAVEAQNNAAKAQGTGRAVGAFLGAK